MNGNDLPIDDPILYILAGSGYTTVNKRLSKYFHYPELVTRRKVDELASKHRRVQEYAKTCPPMSVFLESTFNYG